MTEEPKKTGGAPTLYGETMKVRPVRLTPTQIAWCEANGGVSAAVRSLIEREIKKYKKAKGGQ